MKVLIWTDVFPTYSETFVRDHVIGLLKRNIEVEIYSNTKQNSHILNDYLSYNLFDKIFTEESYLPSSYYSRFFKAFCILSSSLFTSNFKFYLKSLDFLKFKKKATSLSCFFLLHYVINKNINIIHAHFGTNARKLTFLKEIRYPISLISTFHGYDTRIDERYAKLFYRKLFKYVDAVVCISNYNLVKLTKFGLENSKIKRVNNGVLIPEKTSTYVSNENKVIDILSVGRLVNDKNYSSALKALSELKNNKPNISFKYHIIGDGYLRSDLEDLVIDLKLKSCVVFYGYKKSSFVKEIMSKVHFLLLPSINEALPTVVLEAQSFGLPVLATNVGSVKDLVNPDTGILVEPNSYDLYQGLIEIFSKRSLWENMGKNAREFIKQNYCHQIQLDLLETIYNSIINEKN
tara:strand:- start:280 stop:1491 length:1212 start_codon:yes stop_codon:yes gene_type:complete